VWVGGVGLGGGGGGGGGGGVVVVVMEVVMVGGGVQYSVGDVVNVVQLIHKLKSAHDDTIALTGVAEWRVTDEHTVLEQ
jgi:hypothetical protein